MIGKCGKTSKHSRKACYGHACLDSSTGKCNHGLAFVRDTQKHSLLHQICFQSSTEDNENNAEVICKELGFPVNGIFKPTASNSKG